jgi:hypothetical protein
MLGAVMVDVQHAHLRPKVRVPLDRADRAGRHRHADDQRIDAVTGQLMQPLQQSADRIAAGVVSGVSALTTGLSG